MPPTDGAACAAAACSGPVSGIVPFFDNQLGFRCPVRKDVGSFLQVRARPRVLTTAGARGLLRVQQPLAVVRASPRPAACRPCAQEVTTPVGQYAYASGALLERKGLTEEDRDATKVWPAAAGGSNMCGLGLGKAVVDLCWCVA